MSWKKISDIRIICKRCNNEMVFETSRNDDGMIWGCRDCKEQIYLRSDTTEDGHNKVGGMQPPTKKDKKVGVGHFGIMGGIVKKSSSNMFLFKVMCDDLGYLRRFKEMTNWFFVDDGFMTTCQLGFYDKKLDKEE